MVFTEIDKKTMQTLCTLVKLSAPVDRRKDAIVHVGQYLGVPKDDTLELLYEWEEYDTMEFSSDEEKKLFVEDCFSYMSNDYHPHKSDQELYDQVVKNLGLKARSDN